MQVKIKQLTNLLQATKSEAIGALIAVFVCLLIILIIIKVLFGKKQKPQYFVKERLLTPTEVRYYNVIRYIIGEKFLLLPQINLASVINKKGQSNFRSELFRNIDFGIFDLNFRPLILIEINDNTHLRKDRIARDKKVADICKRAGIPLVTFWVKDGINEDYIAKQLNTAIRYYNKRK